VETRIKKIIFSKLYEDLSQVEIIPCDNSLWFIDRENKCWFFEYNLLWGSLWWRLDFFRNFFNLFSMKIDEYEPYICEWVEEVLNCKVYQTRRRTSRCKRVEEVLNCKVYQTNKCVNSQNSMVEQVLNCKVYEPPTKITRVLYGAKENLNYKVNSSSFLVGTIPSQMEEILSQ
jgi:hypothetical protein